MKNFANTPPINDLPRVIPIFPLKGTIILPGADLPLHIFEDRYKKMFVESLKNDRIIGMIQPSDSLMEHDLYKIGCLGRIIGFNETNDGRFFFTLNGVCRFELVNEIESNKDFRTVEAAYDKYDSDYNLNQDFEELIQRDNLIPLLEKYFTKHQIELDLKSLESFSDNAIIQSLSMSCPFEPNEKQLLLEAKDIKERANLFYSLIEISVNSPDYKPTIQWEKFKKMTIDPEILDIIVCPLTKTKLTYDEEKQELISKEAKLAYPIEEGIPILIVEEARKIDDK